MGIAQSIEGVHMQHIQGKSYQEVWDLQHQLMNQIIEAKKNNISVEHQLLFVEHNPVYTLGKSADSSNLLVTKEVLEAKGVELFEIERGGDITFHGPGQWVAYPIFDLEKLGIGLRVYIEKLEEVLIRTCADFGIKAMRVKGLTGVWVDQPNQVPNLSKVAAIGVMSKRYVTMHGFALNVNTDLSYFEMMNPCGITDKGICSFQSLLKKEIDLNEVKQHLIKHFKHQYFT